MAVKFYGILLEIMLLLAPMVRAASEEAPVLSATEQVCLKATDVVLMLDQSGSLRNGENGKGPNRIPAVRKAAEDIVKGLALPVGKNSAIYRVGVYMFSGAAEQLIVQQMTDLKTLQDVENIVTKIETANIHHGQTHIDTALKNVREKMLPNGRPDVNNAVVLIADGEIFKGDDKFGVVEGLLIEQAEKLRDDKTRLIGVGVGAKLPKFREQLMKVVSRPLNENYFEIKDWVNVENFLAKMIAATLTCPPPVNTPGCKTDTSTTTAIPATTATSSTNERTTRRPSL
ncbi:thrombospondin-related anonymous protein-like [Tubulanus polymorphus]|uniref:thrombospondin-related anonymous protein-like n=1 Tax=Tubulanus polymorphus TaxID=672921 RepID=UPI003DA49983